MRGRQIPIVSQRLFGVPCDGSWTACIPSKTVFKAKHACQLSGNDQIRYFNTSVLNGQGSVNCRNSADRFKGVVPSP
jgi:hypothetical protein